MKYQLYKKVLTVSTLFLLTGCVSHLSQEECRNTNWHSRGFNQGAGGNLPNNLSQAQQDCAKFGIAVDTQQYHRGWQAGIAQYCSFETGLARGANGQSLIDYCPAHRAAEFAAGWRQGIRSYCNPVVAFSLGKSGQAQPGFCPVESQAAFNAEYQRGYGIYQHTQTLNDRIQRVERNIARIKDKIHDARKDQSVNRSAEIRDLEHDKRRLEREKDNLQDEIARFNAR